MIKRLALLVLILASSLSLVWSTTAPKASINYVYGNSVASDTFEELPKVGTIFTDDKNNVLIVRDSNENVVVFDKISTRSTVEVGSTLTEKGLQKLLFLRASMNHAEVGYSMSTLLYPLKPLALSGVAYSKTFDGVYFTLGFESDVVLSKLWDSNFTLIEDGGITGWCTAGVLVKKGVTFACLYGLSYRHYIGTLRWELGYESLHASQELKYSSAFLGVGISL